MIYSALSLNGNWKMDYAEDNYLSDTCPVLGKNGRVIPDAVPAYWEDMTDKFKAAPFFRELKINPEYGLQQYPIFEDCPDMALPTIVGNFFYEKKFVCAEITDPAVLYFGGVQNAASVWLNGKYLGRHEGYSSPFEMKIPDGLLINGENTVTLSVSSHNMFGFDGQLVSGLTNRAASQYSGGVTGDVELRVYGSALRDVKITVSEDCSEFKVEPISVGAASYNYEILDGKTVIRSGKADGAFTLSSDGLEKWSPESPKRYILKLACGESVLEREFGIRRLNVEGVDFRLNGEPYYLRGICEHCYYPETVHLPHDISFYRGVIKKLKQLGFNYIRFHTHVPVEEYMQAADELGMLMHVETPNNATYEEWCDIVKFCRRHVSTVIYCGGNELLLHDEYIAHLNKCADMVHAESDSLFSPMSALRGIEYFFVEPEQEKELADTPFRHHPRRFEETGRFSDLYNSYADAHFSYCSTDADVEYQNSLAVVYKKPRVTHEICIDGTYADISLKERYKNTLIGRYTDMFDSIERHLRDKGVFERAPLYFRNSCEWQRRIRKHCFEAVRLTRTIAGYDFLGPIDTHWHTFGYDVGMMNEFYEMKPGETVRNVLMYNSETVLLNTLGMKANFACGDVFNTVIKTSYFGHGDLNNASLSIRLSIDGKAVFRDRIEVNGVKSGELTDLYEINTVLPEYSVPKRMTLYVTLENDSLFTENEWELYLFPKVEEIKPEGITVFTETDEQTLVSALENGEKVVIFGDKPFKSYPTSFRLALAGRTWGLLSTVIADHPIFRDLPHEGFCSWQFSELLKSGSSIVLEGGKKNDIPIVEIIPTHKNHVNQGALFEYNALGGKLLVCGFRFRESDPAAVWLKNEIIKYAMSEEFEPKNTIDGDDLHAIINREEVTVISNSNAAFNPNDKTAVRKK